MRNNRQLWGQFTAVCSSQRSRFFGRGGAAVLGLLFPPACSVCSCELRAGWGDILVCDACRGEIVQQYRACLRCARPLPVVAPAHEICLACRRSQRRRIARTAALGVYGGPLRDAVIRMKQARNEPLAVALGQLLAERCLTLERPELIAPVPMHWTRRLSRGVNCPEVLSEVLSQKLRVPLARDLLRCRRKTKKQGTLLPVERRINVRGAYASSKGYDINGAEVLVVDDVMTTGATGQEIAKVLRQAGARSVSLAVVARGIGF